MTSHDLQSVALTLVASGKGILAADETIPTLTRRFDALGIQSTEHSRRAYREMLLTSRGAEEFISGVIIQDEPFVKRVPMARHLLRCSRTRASFPASRSTGAKPLAGSPARVSANAHALARYAALCQEQHLVPIVEPEVLMDGPHTIERCEEVTGTVLHAVFHALVEQGVALEAMLLKPNMVIPGKECSRQASLAEVATATLRCLRRHVPVAVPGIVFLSGGQNALLATAHLNAVNRLPDSKPWKVSFSYGRALQDPALEA